MGTVAGIALNPLIGWAGDLGLAFAACSLGAGLLAVGTVVVLVLRGPAGEPASR